MIYPDLAEEEIDRIAYFFIGDYEGKASVDEYTAPLVESIRQWQFQASASMLADVVGDDMVTIFDTRCEGHPRVFVVRGLLSDVLQQCRSITNVDHICRSLFDVGSRAHIKPKDVDRALEILMEQGVVVREGHLYMGLTVPLHSAYQPAPEALERLETLFGDTEEGECADRTSLESRRAVEVLSL
jgi:hypothetical protein